MKIIDTILMIFKKLKCIQKEDQTFVYKRFRNSTMFLRSFSK